MRLPSKHLKIVFQPRDAVSSITKGIYNIHWESRNVTEMCWSCGTSAISQISQDQLNINSGTSRLECGNLPDQLNNVAEPWNTCSQATNMWRELQEFIISQNCARLCGRY